MLSVSTAFQVGLITAAIIIPMAHVSALPPFSLVPRPPIPKLRHVDLVAVDESVKRAAMASGAKLQIFRPPEITAPTRIPDNVAQFVDYGDPLPPGLTTGGDSFGVPGLSPTVDLHQRAAAPPPQQPKQQVQTTQPTVPVRVRAGGQVRPPKLLREVHPAYPPLARQARIQGVVKINAIVSRAGSVQSLQIV
ncbi:MAG: energy transducer TonB, partial [Acidobacteriota bacterium]